MKAHKYWSYGALVSMAGAFYTGYKGPKSAHKYFAYSTLFCMGMATYSGYEMIRKKIKATEEPIPEELISEEMPLEEPTLEEKASLEDKE